MSKPQVGYLRLLVDNSRFRRVYLAMLISFLGDWFNLLALLAMLRALGSDSAMAFGGLLILKAAPAFFATPWSGVIADRYPRISVMIGSDIIRAISVSAMFLVLIWPNPWIVYAMIILQSACTPAFESARNAVLPDIVSPEELTAANALGAASWSAMLTIGAALGGLATSYLGWKLALAIDAFTYLVSAALLVGIVEPNRGESSLARGGWTMIKEGLRHIRARADIFTLCFAKMGWNVAGAVTLALTLNGETRFAMGSGGIIAVSLLYMSRGIGTGCGPLLGRWISRSEPKRMDALIGWGYLIGSVCYIAGYWANSLPMAMLLVASAHIGGAIVWVFSSIRLQQLVESELRGRVFSVETAAFLFFFIISNLMAAWAWDSFSLSPEDLFLIIGLLLLIPFAAWTWRQKVLSSE